MARRAGQPVHRRTDGSPRPVTRSTSSRRRPRSRSRAYGRPRKPTWRRPSARPAVRSTTAAGPGCPSTSAWATSGSSADCSSEARETIADLITDELGCPITQSRALQATSPVAIIDAYLATAETYPFVETREATTGRALVSREPVGVVAAITPWNQPMGICVQKVVPALIVGCTVVLKPAPQTALSGYLFAELIEKAGIPAGVVNVVPADREASEALVDPPGRQQGDSHGIDRCWTSNRCACAATTCAESASSSAASRPASCWPTPTSIRQSKPCAWARSATTARCAPSRQGCWCRRRSRPRCTNGSTASSHRCPSGTRTTQSTQIGPMVTADQRVRVASYIDAGRSERRDPRRGRRPVGAA